MADVVVRTRRITRDKLAQFLPSHELIKAFESFTDDIISTLPTAIGENADAINDAQQMADSALALAAAAMGMANLAAQLAAVPNDGPPPAPVITDQAPDDLVAQLAALREEVNSLRALINDRTTGPTP
jgi:HPt (histidine-containing phosphotransfer) domain-containing protein